MNITITNYKPYVGKSTSLKGKFSFELFLLERIDATKSLPLSFKFHDCLHWIKDGKEWFTFPEKRFKGSNGEWEKEAVWYHISSPKDEAMNELRASLKVYLTEHPYDLTQNTELTSFQ